LPKFRVAQHDGQLFVLGRLKNVMITLTYNPDAETLTAPTPQNRKPSPSDAGRSLETGPAGTTESGRAVRPRSRSASSVSPYASWR
jgi:hypothetical protein